MMTDDTRDGIAAVVIIAIIVTGLVYWLSNLT